MPSSMPTFRRWSRRSFRSRVWIVSPTTLMATLTTVRAVLKDVAAARAGAYHPGRVAALLDDVVRLDERVGKLQRHFEQATEDVRQIRISTEKVGKRAERIEELQVGDVSGAASTRRGRSFRKKRCSARRFSETTCVNCHHS